MEDLLDFFEWYLFKHNGTPSDWLEAKERLDKLREQNKKKVGFDGTLSKPTL